MRAVVERFPSWVVERIGLAYWRGRQELDLVWMAMMDEGG